MCAENENKPVPKLPFNEFSSELSFRIFQNLTHLLTHNPNLVCAPEENFSDVGIITLARRARKIAEILSGVEGCCCKE